MSAIWHRVAYYLGLREDPGARSQATGDGGTEAEEAGIVLSLLALAAASVLSTFLIHLISGGDMSADGILERSGLFFLVAAIPLAVSAVIRSRRER